VTSRESRFLLIFDLDGTLLDFEKSECISLRKALAKYDRHLDDTQVAEYRRINAEEWRRFESGSQSIDETTIRRFQRFLAEEGFEELSHLAAEINTEFLTALSELALYEPYAYETLEQLRQRGYRMGLLTNGVRWVQERRLARSGLNPFFHAYRDLRGGRCGKAPPGDVLIDTGAFPSQAGRHPVHRRLL